MVCKTPSVKRVADKSVSALEQLEKLEKRVRGKANAYEADFNATIEKHLEKANITDAQFLNKSIEIKVEYATEFSLDAIAGVVTSAIKAYGAAVGGDDGKVTAATATSPEALDAYVAVVNQVAEAAKSSSKSASSFSFSMNRLGPGVFAFLSAISSNLEDKETFGNETINATCLMYQLIRSEDDIRSTTSFTKALIQAATFKAAGELDKELVLKWKEMQLDLPDKVASGEMNIETYMSLDALYQIQVENALQRLDNEHFGAASARSLTATSQSNNNYEYEPRNYSSLNLPLKNKCADQDFETLQDVKKRQKDAKDEALEACFAKSVENIEKRMSTTSHGEALLQKLHQSTFPMMCNMHHEETKQELPEGVTQDRENLIRVVEKKWVNGTQLNYFFYKDENYKGSTANMNLVRKAFRTWKDVGIGLIFKEVADVNQAQIRIAFKQDRSAWSYVGRDILNVEDVSKPTMNFGWDLTTDPRGNGLDTPLHEIGHTLGFPHEHQNPNAGIEWNQEVVYMHYAGPPNNWDREKTYHNIIRQIDHKTVEGSNWDPNSIMHYDFAPNLVWKPEKYRKEGLYPADGLTDTDKAMVRKFYPPIDPSKDFETLEVTQSSKLDVELSGQKNYNFDPTTTGTYIFQIIGDADVLIVLCEKNEDGNFQYMHGDDDSTGNGNARIKTHLIQGHHYVARTRLIHKSPEKEIAIIVSHEG